ncbi:MAG: AmmeMemoRadiSam system protein B [Candidatus Omnitrophota bacterium]
MGQDKVRKAAVAGQFYPGKAKDLEEQIKAFIEGKPERKKAIACMLPHAGYIYSGRVAVKTVSSIDLPQTLVLMGPNHTGSGEEFSIMSEGTWQTPLGEIEIDSGLAKRMLEGSCYLKDDSLAHAYEHSLEVELPILQFFRKDFKIVPIAFLSGDIEALKKIGSEIAGAIKDSGSEDSVLLVASSDMTHYEPQEYAQKKDNKAIESILELDEDSLIRRILSLNISMCGYAPVAVMLKAAKLLGAKGGRLIKYQTSGDITGDKESVVGYAGIIIN